MTQHRTRVSPLLFTTLTLTTLIVALTLAIWGLLSGVLRTPADGLGNPDVATGASRYVAQRPLDPAGWLAWAGTRRLLVSDAALGGKIVDTASSLGPVDPQVLRAQALLAFQQGDVGAGLDRVADLASAFPAEAGDAFAVMRDHAGHRDWAKFWAARLARRWPAADSFLLYSCQSGASLSTLFALAQPAVSRQPLTDATVNCIGNKAISEGRIPAAHWLWVNASRSMPRSIGNVFNGDFEQPVSGHLFDWRFSAGGEYREGFVAALIRDDASKVTAGSSGNGKNHVLSIRFNGRALKLPIAQQYLALAPGRYTLTYRARESGVVGAGTVRWVIRCALANATVSPSPVRSAAAPDSWTTYTVDVSIPNACTGQLLDLEAGDRLQLSQGYRGTVFFDDITIKRNT